MLRNSSSLAVLALGVLIPQGGSSAAISPAPSSRAAPNKDVQQLIIDAQRAAKAGNLEDARHSLDIAASLQPRNADIIAQLAIVLNKMGDYEGALTRVRAAQALGAFNDTMLGAMLEAMLSMGQNQKVLDLFPDPGPDKHTYAAGVILRARASALEVLGDPAGANLAIARSLAIVKDYDGLMTAARIDRLQGKFDAADAQADSALKLKAGDIDARILKIDLAMQRHDLRGAQQMSEQLVADYPRSELALLARAKVNLSIDRTEEAEPDIDRVLAARPKMPIATYYKAVILARHGDVKGAWNIAHNLSAEFVQSDPDFALNVADMAIGAGFVNTGAGILTVAVLHFPSQLELRLRLADLRLRQNSPAEALNDLALVQDSVDPRVLVLFARAALLKNDRAGAQKYIERVLDGGGGIELRTLDKDVALQSMSSYIARHPTDKLAPKQYALLLLGFGETDKAKEAYEKLVRADPSDGVALNNLSWLVVGEDPRRALLLANEAAKLDPTSANFLDTLGSMQMGRSDFRGALFSLQKAHSLAPDNAEFSYHLALALEASGQVSQARTILKQLAERRDFRDWAAVKDLLARKEQLQPKNAH